MNRAVIVALSLVIATAGCADTSESTPTTRAPLESPPDPGPVPDHDGLDPALRERVAASTVRVSGIACGRSSEGSGFAIAEELIVTNAHVLLGVDRPVVEDLDGVTAEGTVVAFDAADDLALVRVEGASFVPLPLGRADDGTVGGVFGWEPGPELEVTPFRIDRPVTVRIDAVASDERVSRSAYLLAADIESGDSGAALVDATGTVVGVAYATTTRSASVAYAVRAGEVQDLVDRGFNDNLIVPDCTSR